MRLFGAPTSRSQGPWAGTYGPRLGRSVTRLTKPMNRFERAFMSPRLSLMRGEGPSQTTKGMNHDQ
jgi:hypothetical protein